MNTWTFDAKHSNISFSVRHMLVSRVRGEFTRWTGELRFDENQPEQSSFSARIDASSIDTNEPQRDEHLRTGDFFDVARWPQIFFRSRQIVRVDAQHFRVIGDLTIRNLTREATLEVTYGGKMRDPSGIERIGFSAQATIDRKAYGMVFNQVLDTGGLALGNKIEILIDVEATRLAGSMIEGDLAA
jgi:polyisoprenoid-binding protein YceI